jgi:hypothetical protein
VRFLWLLANSTSCLIVTVTHGHGVLSADNGLPLRAHKPGPGPTASEPSTTYNLPRYHKPYWCVACVSVCMRVLCNNFCSVCVCVQLCSLSKYIHSHVSLVYALLSQLYGLVSLCTQLLLMLFIYWSLPLLFDKPLITISGTMTSRS